MAKRNLPIDTLAFYRVFESLQMCGWYALYYDLDWSEDEVKKFSEETMEYNLQYRYDTEKTEIEENRLAEALGFDFVAESKKFPKRTAIAMMGKVRGFKITDCFRDLEEAINSYLFLTAGVLETKYNFTGEQYKEWLEKVYEISSLYATGMKDSHLKEYFKRFAGLPITK